MLAVFFFFSPVDKQCDKVEYFSNGLKEALQYQDGCVKCLLRTLDSNPQVPHILRNNYF